MKKILTVSDLPNVPAVYSLYGGGERGKYVAYVGIADSLKRRIIQHLVNKDSSISTGTAAAGLNANYVKEVRWWENSYFKNRNALEASEIVAFEILNPVLRSRGKTNQKAKKMNANKIFQEK